MIPTTECPDCGRSFPKSDTTGAFKPWPTPTTCEHERCPASGTTTAPSVTSIRSLTNGADRQPKAIPSIEEAEEIAAEEHKLDLEQNGQFGAGA